jgi:hypothetical protein
MLNICIRTQPHELQRNQQVGDWQCEEEGFSQDAVVVSNMPETDYEFLVGVHELLEMYLCLKRGILPFDVTKFDEEFEKNREIGDTREAGDHPSAPYFREHQFSTKIEKLIAEELGVDWDAYEKAVNSL